MAQEGMQLIASVIATGSRSTLSQVSSDMFTASETDVYEFVRAHSRRYGELPSPATVQEETGIRLPTPREPLQFYLDAIEDRHIYGMISSRWSDARESLAAKRMDDVRDHLEAMYRMSRTRRATSDTHYTLRDATQLSIDRLRATRGLGGITGIESGWPGVDVRTGGYQNGDLITLVGRMGLGKTYVLLKQAAYARLQGHTVLVVTTEMSAEQIARRNISIRLGVNPSLLKKNMVSTYMERRIQALCTDHAWIDGYHIFSVGMNSACDRIEALMQEINPDIVYVDGAYLLRPTNMSKSMNRNERVAGTIDELKALTLSADRPIYISTQFNRVAGKGGKEGTLETIGFTDSIGTHSSAVKALKQGPTENPMHSRYLEFLKGREGETGQIAINFKFAPLDMEEIDDVDEIESAGDVEVPNVDWQL